MLAVSLAAQGVLLLSSLAISARATIRTRSILRGGLCLYVLFVLWAVLFCVILPAAFIGLGVENHRVARAFPEAIGVPAVVFVYWIPAFAFAGLVRMVTRKSADSRDRGAESQ